MNIKIFGTKKCSETKKAERWFKERSIPFQLINLAEKGLAAGELRNIAAAVGGMDAIIDKEGKRYVDKGLKYAYPNAAKIEALLLEDALLCKTPLVRNGKQATIGAQPSVWETWK